MRVHVSLAPNLQTDQYRLEFHTWIIGNMCVVGWGVGGSGCRGSLQENKDLGQNKYLIIECLRHKGVKLIVNMIYLLLSMACGTLLL